MSRCLLNIDLGELAVEPEELYALAHIANIACGGHAGDDTTIARSLVFCLKYGTKVGAHPSYPDRAGFGRTAMSLAPDQVRTTVAEQCDRLVDAASRSGQRIEYVKAHGALYHSANMNSEIAHAVVGGAVEALGYEIQIIGSRTPAMLEATEAAGIGLLREQFADRATRTDGSLVPRTEPGAVIADVAIATKIAEVFLQNRTADTLCVHGDTPHAVIIARAIRALLDRVDP